MIRWTRRVATIWAIEFVALVLLARWIPGLELASWWTAIPAVAAIAFLNALLRPLLLLLMMLTGISGHAAIVHLLHQYPAVAQIQTGNCPVAD